MAQPNTILNNFFSFKGCHTWPSLEEKVNQQKKKSLLLGKILNSLSLKKHWKGFGGDNATASTTTCGWKVLLIFPLSQKMAVKSIFCFSLTKISLKSLVEKDFLCDMQNTFLEKNWKLFSHLLLLGVEPWTILLSKP